MKNHHISEAGVSFEIQFGLWIKIWAAKHIFHVWQQTIALTITIGTGRQCRCIYCSAIFSRARQITLGYM